MQYAQRIGGPGKAHQYTVFTSFAEYFVQFFWGHNRRHLQHLVGRHVEHEGRYCRIAVKVDAYFPRRVADLRCEVLIVGHPLRDGDRLPLAGLQFHTAEGFGFAHAAVNGGVGETPVDEAQQRRRGLRCWRRLARPVDSITGQMARSRLV